MDYFYTKCSYFTQQLSSNFVLSNFTTMKKNLLQDKKIAIIGAGPVGLTTARLLQQANVDVHVYEWDNNAEVRIFGGTLDIHKNTGQLALEKAGLLDAFYAAARPTGEHLVGKNGESLMYDFPNEEQLYQRPEIDRNDLRQLLLQNLAPDTVVWGKQLKEIIKIEEHFILRFEDGTEAYADVVIGANGSKSKVRQRLTTATPKFTGTIIIQGEVFNPELNAPNYKALCKEDNVMVIADKTMFASQIKSKGTINYFFCFKAEETFANDENIDVSEASQVADYLKKVCSDWDPKFIELFEATKTFWVLPMRNMPLDEKWQTEDAITLVGDAAHAMPPFAGVGVNIGMLDALRLSENLLSDKFDSIREAMEDYEQNMFDYAGEAQRDTASAESDFFSDTAIEDHIKGREEWNKTL